MRIKTKNALPRTEEHFFYQQKSKSKLGSYPQINFEIVAREAVPAICVCQI